MSLPPSRIGLFGIALTVIALGIAAGFAKPSVGGGPALPDVVYGNCHEITNWGEVGGVRGYSLGSWTCNIGDGNLLWGGANDGSPVLAMNAYRLENGRLVQIGLSFVKHSTNAFATDGCDLACNGQGSTVLGAGCRDIYSANFNGAQSRLGPRSQTDPWSGLVTPTPAGTGNVIFRRLQIRESDLDASGHPGALYFVEGVYVARDDAGIFGNGYNNASHRPVVVGAGFDLTPVGATEVSVPAIFAWQSNGGGPGVPDPAVEIQSVDVPGEGRFFVATKTTDLGDGTWQYDYAIFNLNSQRAARAFVVPLGVGATLTRGGFHDVDYHSGEVYDGTDWTALSSATNASWSSAQTFDENPNANALRWGTMYNFWMTVDAPPADVEAQIELFRPGSPSAITVTVPGPVVVCPADLDDSGSVDFADLSRLLQVWGTCSGCPEDLDGSGAVGLADLTALLPAWGPC